MRTSSHKLITSALIVTVLFVALGSLMLSRGLLGSTSPDVPDFQPRSGSSSSLPIVSSSASSIPPSSSAKKPDCNKALLDDGHGNLSGFLCVAGGCPTVGQVCRVKIEHKRVNNRYLDVMTQCACQDPLPASSSGTR